MANDSICKTLWKENERHYVLTFCEVTTKSAKFRLHRLNNSVTAETSPHILVPFNGLACAQLWPGPARFNTAYIKICKTHLNAEKKLCTLAPNLAAKTKLFSDEIKIYACWYQQS